MTQYTLHQGDCLEVMRGMEAGSVDAIITDLPYGTTACSWDEVIPFEPMWEAVRHVLKSRGAFVTTASQPFTSKLIMSNLDWFKYCWVWDKSRAVGFPNAKNKPMNKHEDIVVFSKGNCANNCNLRMVYNPQGLVEINKTVSGIKECAADKKGHRFSRPSHKKNRVQQYTSFPNTVLSVNNEGETLHPTQKPVALYEYLIRTYTNEGDTVLDMTIGSGTTGVAAMRTGRKFIGIELDPTYYAIAEERIRNAAGEIVVTAKEKERGMVSLFDWANSA